ncbi:MAG: Planctomycete cytochrome, partial [Planctomycetaceae bacterium]|nr:Planctomycete cytochrome [Planctomycetaceae bacterium]
MRNSILGFLLSTVLGGMLLLLAAPNLRSSEDPPAKAPSYEKTIQPLLQKRCYSCHSGKETKGGLRLDSRTTAMKGGNSGSVIEPGKSVASELLARVASDDDGLRMPPKGERLSTEEVAILRQWIDAGADGPATGKVDIVEPHWSLKPLTPVAVPPPAAGGHPLDAFVDAKLALKSLKRSSPADRRTLIRRVTFDLTGLPPTPEETKAFIEDVDPKAYEKLVDRLLASPRYGE